MAEKVYLLPIWDTIETAWRKMYGSKGSLWAALITAFCMMIIYYVLSGIIAYLVPNTDIVVEIIINFLNCILFSGIVYIALRHVFDLPISFDMMFQVFKSPLFLNVVLFHLIYFIIFFIFALIFILSAIVFNLAIPFISLLSTIIGLAGIIGSFFVYYRIYPGLGFVLDGHQGPWQAMQSAFNVTRYNVLRLFAIHLLALIIIILSIIPLGIGLIWTIPFTFNLYGVTYRRLLFNMSSTVEVVERPRLSS